jgi:hypothetical protein
MEMGSWLYSIVFCAASVYMNEFFKTVTDCIRVVATVNKMFPLVLCTAPFNVRMEQHVAKFLARTDERVNKDELKVSRL